MSLGHHIPVLAAEVLHCLDPKPGQTIVDCTVGAAGHARLLGERVAPSGRVIALDQDAAMLERARLVVAGLPVTFVHASFDQLREVLREQAIPAVDGVLVDLGVCSDQLDDAARGFSFQEDGPLDMRLDRSRGAPASELLARLPERELADLIFAYGEERFSRRIARRIVEARRTGVPETTGELAALIRRCVPRSRGIDPATRTFQALRIAVNDELGALERLLRQLPGCVNPGGRVAIISFHSLEDRRVKQAFQSDDWSILTRKPITAGDDEVRANPRSRSAKLRCAQRATGLNPAEEFGSG
jgi:16S rRNA (cytosine1402-N4)-methyltransferase